jgi:hypothetical protein
MLHEIEIVRALETERRMMERQRLLKELWRLQNQPDSVTTQNPTTRRKPATSSDFTV